MVGPGVNLPKELLSGETYALRQLNVQTRNCAFYYGQLESRYSGLGLDMIALSIQLKEMAGYVPDITQDEIDQWRRRRVHYINEFSR
jgi:hypothetical protein